MKFDLKAKVKVISEGQFKGRTGFVVERHDDMDVEPVYTVAYDEVPGRGMFVESSLMSINKPLMVYLELPPMDKHAEAIAEGLLHICKCKSIYEHPDGRRIFTVKKMPDNVPVAGIKWAVYEPQMNRK